MQPPPSVPFSLFPPSSNATWRRRQGVPPEKLGPFSTRLRPSAAVCRPIRLPPPPFFPFFPPSPRPVPFAKACRTAEENTTAPAAVLHATAPRSAFTRMAACLSLLSLYSFAGKGSISATYSFRDFGGPFSKRSDREIPGDDGVPSISFPPPFLPSPSLRRHHMDVTRR